MNRKARRAAGKSHKPDAAASPGFADALVGRASELLAGGEEEAALELACRAIGLARTPETKTLFVRCVKGWSYFPGAEAMQATLADALREAWARPTELLGPALGILEHDPLIGAALQRAGAAWPRRLSASDLLGPDGLAAIAAHPLLPALLESVQVPGLACERLLTNLRCAVLEAAGRGVTDDRVVRFAAALAQQCFINEYVFAVTAEEAAAVDRLHDTIAAALHHGRPVKALGLAALAAYRGLEDVPARPLDARAWPAALSNLLDQQVREPRAVARARATIPTLTPIADAVSRAVRSQYEENPYPRWVRSPAAGPPVTLQSDLQRQFPHLRLDPPGAAAPLDILVAGCGTGQHAIDFARQYADAAVLAIDLSRSSLAYAQVKTATLGLDTITYAQADLLELTALGRSFDVVTASGVLHHLATPLAGWRVLVSLLRPGGYMHIGLYSAAARRGVVAARQWIAANGYQATVADIRRCRQDLQHAHHDGTWRGIFDMIDFYSTSECRDLLFHVQEHHFTIPQIARFLEDSGLRFLGFTIDAATRRRFRARFPADQALSDLALWHAFETDHLDTFINMYQFWVHKPQVPREG